MSDEFIVQDEDRFAWMDDAIDKESVAVAGFELPKRTLAQATAILNYDSTLKAYKTSGAPEYSSGRAGAKRRRLDASEEDSFASVVSPVFERQQRDALGTSGEQVAHIIPRDTGRAVFYEAPAIGALGAPSPMTRCQKQSLIHGSRPASALSRAKEDTRRQIRRRILRKRPPPDTRLQPKACHTGLKHCNLNKIQLLEHQPYAKSPYLIIQPALTVDKILSWTPGTSYNVICMVAEDTSNQARVDYRQRFSACHDAPEKYVSRAVETLGVFVRSLANSLKNMQDFEELVKLARKQDNLEDGELLPLRANRNRLLTEKTIICPVFSEAKLVNSKVAIITLTHSIPDPYLLCVKAAVNWSNANDQKILPGGVYEYEDEESVDSSIQLSGDVFDLRSNDEEISDLDEEGLFK